MAEPSGADTQHQRGAPASIAVTWTDQDGVAAAAVGAVTVHVQTADGTDVIAAGSSTTGSNPYARALTASQTETLELLTATWTDAGNSATRVTHHEIVERFYFSPAELRARETSLADTDKFTNAAILGARREVEEECEEFCGVAWVPRFRRVTLNGDGTLELLVPDTEIRTIRSVTIDGSALTSGQLATIDRLPDGRLVRSAGWPSGEQNIVLEYEHGRDRPPRDLVRAAMMRTRFKLNAAKTTRAVSDATTWTAPDGTRYEVDPEGEQRTVFRTYARFSPNAGGVVASRPLEFNPMRDSLFHGGDR